MGTAVTTGPVSVTLEKNKFPAIAKSLEPAIERFLAKAAFDIEAWAKVAAPYATGFLSGSITAYRVQALWWRVAVGAEYGVYVEFGTRYMAARPYLVPAFERVVPSLKRALGGLSKGFYG
jgi:hypothetical protein